MKSKFKFSYDRFTRQGIIVTENGKTKLDTRHSVNEGSYQQKPPLSQQGSGLGGYGIELI